ncbi:MAG: hypothetical protein ACM3PY_02880 [Omnitrophica WOR_2 bacterium]
MALAATDIRIETFPRRPGALGGHLDLSFNVWKRTNNPGDQDHMGAGIRQDDIGHRAARA